MKLIFILDYLFGDVEVVETGPADPCPVVLDHHGRHGGHQTSGAGIVQGWIICLLGHMILVGCQVVHLYSLVGIVYLHCNVTY